MAQTGLLKLELGESVIFEDTEYFISQISDLTHAILIHPKTRDLKEVPISEISGVSEAKPTSDLELISSEKWDEAILRYDIIKPLLIKKRTRALVEERAKEYGRSPTTSQAANLIAAIRLLRLSKV
ncbi:MAG: hypothetical protein U9N57_01365 [Pseudomonadota bacterium]|nr:hypothetical protein [Pseudomonadota bacterium]